MGELGVKGRVSGKATGSRGKGEKGGKRGGRGKWEEGVAEQETAWIIRTHVVSLIASIMMSIMVSIMSK